MLTAPPSPVPHRHAPDHRHGSGHEPAVVGHDIGEHDHHGHSHGHDHAHAEPRVRQARPARIRSLMALSAGQRLLLVLPILGGLWLAAYWAMS
jgi:hypothetical protein